MLSISSLSKNTANTSISVFRLHIKALSLQQREKHIRTTRKTGGLLTGYKPVVLDQRLKALAFTTFKPHSH